MERESNADKKNVRSSVSSKIYSEKEIIFSNLISQTILFNWVLKKIGLIKCQIRYLKEFYIHFDFKKYKHYPFIPVKIEFIGYLQTICILKILILNLNKNL